MGFVLTLVYLLVAILSPAEVVPSLANYHIQIWVGCAAILASLPAALSPEVLLVPQVRFLGLVTMGVFASFLAQGWLGGGVLAVEDFVPTAVVFYLILINFRTLPRLRILAIVLIAISLFIVAKGSIAYVRGDFHDAMIYVQRTEDDQGWLMRLRAFGVLNDPNDLAQYLVATVPMLWLNWREKKRIRNFVLVIAPAGVLVTGVFLTHSRGAMLALAAVLLFAFKDKLGTTRAALIAGIGFALASAVNFSGGRDISLEAGAERIEAWGAGLGMLLSSPLFGVGYHQFYEHYERAAHNTFVHCAAELGLFGYFFWMALIVFSMSDLGVIIRHSPAPMKGGSAKLQAETGDPPASIPQPAEAPSNAESPVLEERLKRWATVLREGFVGYLTAGVFISRSYVVTLFVLVGVAGALRTIATHKAGIGAMRQPFQLYRMTAALVVSSLIWIYIAVRIRWMP